MFERTELTFGSSGVDCAAYLYRPAAAGEGDGPRFRRHSRTCGLNCCDVSAGSSPSCAGVPGSVLTGGGWWSG